MRVARALVPSDGMQRVFRLVAAIREAAAARGETAVIVDATPTGPGTLDVGALAAIEAELGTELHDDILAVLAARIPMLTTATALAIDRVLDRATEADVPAGWVSIAWASERPFEARREPGHGGDIFDLCVPVPARAESVVAPGGFFDAPQPFPDWAEHQLRRELSERSDWLAITGRVAAVAVPQLDALALVGRVPEPPAAVTRHVIHDKFGAGTVVRALDGGSKLVVAFADGERTLLARFVRDV